MGAGSPVSFVVSGQFADIDGSEEHYFLVEQQPGWTGNYQTVTVDGVIYFMVPISTSVTANPSVTVNLTTPPGLTADGPITLNVSGMSVDGASVKTSDITTSTTVQVGVVNASGVSLSMDPASEYEGGDAPGTQMEFDWVGTPQNDTLNTITIADLKGGVILDGNGNVLFSSGPATLDGATALAGGYYYRPPAYGKGEIALDFTATASDNNSGAQTTFNQSGSITVDAVSTVPGDAGGNSEAPVNQAEHQAQVTVNLQADFKDYTGTEDHFFLVQLPTGAIPPAGWTAVTDADLLAAVPPGWTGTFYKVPASADGTASFTVTLQESTPASSIRVLAGSTETPGPVNYVFSPNEGSVDLPSTGLINLAPNSVTETENLPNGGNFNGTVPLTDPDNDVITITAVSINGVPVTETGGSYTGGQYGSFVFDPGTGGYTYLANGTGSGTDVLTVTVSDGKGGTSTSSITMNVGLSRSLALPEDEGGDGVAEASSLLAAHAGESEEPEFTGLGILHESPAELILPSQFLAEAETAGPSVEIHFLNEAGDGNYGLVWNEEAPLSAESRTEAEAEALTLAAGPGLLTPDDLPDSAPLTAGVDQVDFGQLHFLLSDILSGPGEELPLPGGVTMWEAAPAALPEQFINYYELQVQPAHEEMLAAELLKLQTCGC